MAVSVVDVQVNATGATQQLRAVQQGAVATDRAVSGLIGTVRKIAIALGAMQAVKFVFAKTAELESQTRSLEVLTGSAEKAKQIIVELQQLGAVTPFTSTELIDSAKRLQAFGVEADKVVETTRRLADVSGATGAALQGLVTAYGQVQAKGRLQGEELLQFQERGVALQGELQKMYGLSGEELRKALEKGRISAEAVEVAIIRLTDVGGKYANGAIAQSDTLNGKFSTLMDGIEMLAKGVGTLLAPQIKNIINLAIEGINEINNLFAKGLEGDYMRRTDKAKYQMKYGFRSEALDTTGKLLSEISRSPQRATKGGIEAQLAALAGVEKVLNELNNASALPDAVTERVMRQSDAINKLRGDLKGYLNDLKAVTKPTAATPKTPPLLAEKAKDKGGMSMNQLLQTEVLQELEFKKAKEETFKQSQLIQAQQAKMNNEDLVQAKRMIDFASQYRIEQLNTIALEKQLKLINEQRAAVIASYKPDERAGVAEAIDRQRSGIANQILLTQEKTNTIAKQHYREALEAQTQQEELLKKETESQTLLGQQRKQSLTDELALMQARLTGNEAEVILKQQIRNIMLGTQDLDVQEVTNTLKKIDALKQQLTAAQELKALYSDIGMTIKSGVIEAIQGTIDGTKRLQDVALSLLDKIANKLLDVATNFALFGTMSGTGGGGGLLGSFFGGGKSPAAAVGGTLPQADMFKYVDFGGMKAKGGSVSGGTPYLVGERGPELFMPGRSGGIAPTGSFGGGTNVVVNVDATGSNVQGDDQSSKQLGVMLAAAVQKELIKQKRPGGILA
jgi:tape measure domain-containing protein